MQENILTNDSIWHMRSKAEKDKFEKQNIKKTALQQPNYESD